VEAHGSFASQGCIDCKAPFDGAEIRKLIQEERIPRCNRCRGLVKPNIVFFGEAVSVPFPLATPRFVSQFCLCARVYRLGRFLVLMM